MPSFYGRLGIEFKETITAGLEEAGHDVYAVCDVALFEAGEIVRASAYEKANVSKGVLGHGRGGEHMRDEIKVSDPYEYPTGVSVRIGVDLNIIPYAAHQEFRPEPHGKPYLRPAIDETRQQCHDMIQQVLSDFVVHGGRTKVRFRRFA
jgi:hypothetical protein